MRRQPEGVRRLDEALLPQKCDLARDQIGDQGHAGDADHDHDVVDVGLEGGDHEQDQHQPRERVEEVGEVRDERVVPAAAVARQNAEYAAAGEGNRDGEQPGKEVGLDAEDQPRLQIAPEKVGAERVPRGERRRVEQRHVHLTRIMRQPAKSAEQVRDRHQRRDQETVADVDQVYGVGALKERQLRELADRTGGLHVAANAHPAPIRARRAD